MKAKIQNSTHLPVGQGIKIQEKMTRNVRDGVNVTPMIVVDKPVVNRQFKSVLDEIFRFVSVGGDFN